MDSRPRIVVVRGHQVTPWETKQWEPLADRFDVTVVMTASNWFDVETSLPRQRVRALRDLLPPGRLGDTLIRVPGERYLNLAAALEGVDIVHSQELGYWYSAQAARLKAKLGFRLVLTVWETLPFLDAYRNVRTRPYRGAALAATDRFAAVTQRSRDALVLEGADLARIEVCPPGVDLRRFEAAAGVQPEAHRILSVGRLVWEKGHQDVMRALAAVRRGVVDAPEAAARARLTIVGSGPEQDRLRQHAADLDIEHAVEFLPFGSYDRMPALYASASCLVLASLPLWSWEEQFGMVLAEAIAARLPIIASASGAIPEVVDGEAELFVPGDWRGLAIRLVDGPLSRPPGERVPYSTELRERYSVAAAADRLGRLYDKVLGRE